MNQDQKSTRKYKVSVQQEAPGRDGGNNPPSLHRSWMKLLDELLSSAVTLSLRGSMFLVSQLAAL